MISAPDVRIVALQGIGTVHPGDDLCELILNALKQNALGLRHNDVVTVTSKIVSRAEGNFIDLSTIKPSERAQSLAVEIDKDPRLVEVVLQQSVSISRKKRGALIVRHKLGFVSANAGVDASNAEPAHRTSGTGPWVLTLPNDPDATANEIRQRLFAATGADVAVIITDSFGRPFRVGTVGVAIGVSGIASILDFNTKNDRFGRELVATQTALADQIASAADMVAGQSNEGRPVCLVRGLRFEPQNGSALDLLRAPLEDLYADDLLP
ncbi:MAG: coenzyme F420-0:L-glutamate ligase [Polyangiales bacterium]